ncbi:MAG: tyrosine--tRNA ligase [Candidatus Omnitrophota bacterium]
MNGEALKHLNAIKDNSVDLIAEDELLLKIQNSLTAKKPLKLKIGFDPTARDIHLGHTVCLRKLRKLQDLGHCVYLIIGDFTAKIGDPSGRSALRPVLSEEQIKDNARTYTDQVFKILDKSKTKVIYNSTWYKGISVSEFLSLLSCYTVARMLERDDFSKRMKENRPLTILELVYPLIQGYDSVKLEADIEFGGTDQKFNLIVGRHLQDVFGQKPQGVVTMPLLVGLDGTNKMSKSLNNYVGVTEDSKSMFGKLMSISDCAMWEYFRLLTDCDIKEVKAMHPKDAKMFLAETIVSLYHTQALAQKEKIEFESVFSQKKIPREIPVYEAKFADIDVIEVLSENKIVGSKNEARRLLAQGGISIVNIAGSISATVLTGHTLKIPAEGVVVKIGKKKFLKIVLTGKTQ